MNDKHMTKKIEEMYHFCDLQALSASNAGFKFKTRNK
jgi:hypothetical protein